MSSCINITSAIPQGSNLGPLMFFIFINDSEITFPGLMCNLYAGDTAYVAGKDIKIVGTKLQNDVNEILTWFLYNK